MLLSTLSWQCGGPYGSGNSRCDDLFAEKCRKNSDCPDNQVCWLCECIDCPKGALPCGIGGSCLQVANSPLHCGSCNNVCPVSKPICQEGKCIEPEVDANEVKIKAGTFTMGSPKSEIGHYDDEIQHKVTLGQSFYMWRHEITQEEYQEVVGKNPSHFQKCGKDCPVESVSWHEALSFCNELSRRKGLNPCFVCAEQTITDEVTKSKTQETICELKPEFKDARGNPDPKLCWGYRLPTEAEWEYAARAGSTSATYAGELIASACGPDRELTKIGWYCGNSSEAAKPIKQKLPNDWELFDMLGNVREWTWDLYGEYPRNPSTDPIGPTMGSGHVVRGGCWSCRAVELRAAYRFDHSALRREYNLGFRVIRNAPND